MATERFRVTFHHMTRECERWQDGDLLKVYDAEHEIPLGIRVCPACTVLTHPMHHLCLASHFETNGSGEYPPIDLFYTMDEKIVKAVRKKLKELEAIWPKGLWLMVEDGSTVLRLYNAHPEEGGAVIGEYLIACDSRSGDGSDPNEWQKILSKSGGSSDAGNV